jgi:hypothetical protein
LLFGALGRVIAAAPAINEIDITALFQGARQRPNRVFSEKSHGPQSPGSFIGLCGGRVEDTICGLTLLFWRLALVNFVPQPKH